MERESCRDESTAIFQNSCLSGKWVSWKKGQTSFLIKSVLISNRLDLPLQSRQASTQFEGQRRFEEWPSPLAALPAPAAHPGYWLLGWHPPDPNRWSRLGGKGQTPWAPCQSALGKVASWARADIHFRLVYAIEGHTVWKWNAIYPQPLLIMEVESEAEAGSATSCPQSPRGILFPLLLPLSSWADDNRACGWVERWDSACLTQSLAHGRNLNDYQVSL